MPQARRQIYSHETNIAKYEIMQKHLKEFINDIFLTAFSNDKVRNKVHPESHDHKWKSHNDLYDMVYSKYGLHFAQDLKEKCPQFVIQ